MNPFPYSADNKRYHTLAYHNRQKNCKNRKAVLDAGMTCPNIDGTCGFGGCSFCDGGSGYFTMGSDIPITDQLEQEIERIHKKFPGAGITAYFQAHTNTYCSDQYLREILHDACANPHVDSLAVATRPDCLGPGKIKILDEYAQKLPVTVELGLQTVHDETARKFNRGYLFSVFEEAMARLKETSVRVCVHLIDGLPAENQNMMVESARILAGYQPDGVKIHSLHIMRGTRLHREYEEGRYLPLSFEQYIDTVILQLEVLPPETVIERITGDGKKSNLVAPLWSRDKIRVLGTIDSEMRARNTWQGRLYLADK